MKKQGCLVIMVRVLVANAEKLHGVVNAPPSKGYTQRMLIAAALSNGISSVTEPLVCEDTEATLRAVRALGAEVTEEAGCWFVNGTGSVKAGNEPIDCGESGATLRFMIPVAALAQLPTVFVLGESLSKRPINPLLMSLSELGVKTAVEQASGKTLVHVYGGGIAGGKTRIRGDISSQFISGLMFACPMAKHDTEVAISTPLESKEYVRMTESVLAKHGVKVSIAEDYRSVKIPSGQVYAPCNHLVPGDFSSAAFLLAAAVVTRSTVSVKNLEYNSIQGDRAIISILKALGVVVEFHAGTITVKETQAMLSPLSIDATDIPDLVPVCTVLACHAEGISKIYGAHRLRYKESDRLLSLYLELKKMGAEINFDADSLTVKGPCRLHGATIDPHGDHRIAMACAIAALTAEGETAILNAECVQKSYPKFFDDLRGLGAQVLGW